MSAVQLEAHPRQWSEDFKNAVGVIKAILTDNLIAAYHIGSIAVVGIRAKPGIDILLEVKSLNAAEQHSYEAKGEYGAKGGRFFQKGGDKRTHPLHLFESGNPAIERHRLFVALMNAHPDQTAEYEKPKIALANKYKEAPEPYAQGKSVFIQAMDAEAAKWKNS